MTQSELTREYLGIVKVLLAHPLTNCESPDYQLTQILKHADLIMEHATSIVTSDTLKDVVESVFDERFGDMNGVVKDDDNCDLDLTNCERLTIQDALHKARNNRRAAAQMLGISERTLYRKIKDYNLD